MSDVASLSSEVLTCVVHVGSDVEGRRAAGLDLPPRSRVLRCPAAEGRIIGSAKVAGKPEKSCVKKDQDHVSQEKKTLIILLITKGEAACSPGLYPSNDRRACHGLTTGYTLELPSLSLLWSGPLDGSR